MRGSELYHAVLERSPYRQGSGLYRDHRSSAAADPEVNSFIYQYSHNSNANWKRCFTDADAWAPVALDGEQLPRALFQEGYLTCTTYRSGVANRTVED